MKKLLCCKKRKEKTRSFFRVVLRGNKKFLLIFVTESSEMCIYYINIIFQGCRPRLILKTNLAECKKLT